MKDIEADNDMLASLEDNASLISRALVLYMNNFFKISATRSLDFEDLGTVSKKDASSTVFNIALEAWRGQIASQPPGKRSISKSLFSIMGSFHFLLVIFLSAVTRGMNFIPVLVLGQLVEFVSGATSLSIAMQWMLVISLLVVPILGSLIGAQYLILQNHLGIQFKVALINLIYDKSLKMSTAAKSQQDGVSTGQVVTMFSNDTQILQSILFVLTDIFILPITIAIGIYLVYLQVGVATFVGLALFVVAIPPTLFIFFLLSIFRKEKLVFTDERVKLMNELFAGIRVVKLSSWEQAFSAVIRHIRVNELKAMRKSGYSLAVGISLILNAVPIFLPILVFYTYVRIGNTLTTAKAFVTISLFGLIKWPLVQLPGALNYLNIAAVSISRICRHLELDELVSYVGNEFSDDGTLSGGYAKENHDFLSVQLIDATLGWIPVIAVSTVDDPDIACLESPSPEKTDSLRPPSPLLPVSREVVKGAQQYAALPSGESENKKDSAGLDNRSVYTLVNLNLTIRSGSLVAVVGPVGSGKSSLLCALLGELHCQKGKVSMRGTVGYCDQRSWIMNDTVEGNILLGLPYNEDKLNSAIHASCLDEDLKVLSGGLKTQIGEKGVNLSGGQKARVSLARAIYAEKDVYLLDDPLSAVDAHVGQFLFRETICNILKSKTRILVTHQLQYLPYCDQIVAFRDGAIAFDGSYDDFVKSSEFVSISTTEGHQQSDSEIDEGTSAWNEIRDAAFASASQSAEERKTDQRSSTITTVEEREEGFIRNDVYYAYAKSGGLGIAAAVVILMSISQLFEIAGLFWLSIWGSQSASSSSRGNTLVTEGFSQESQIFFLNVLAVIYFIGLVFTVFALIIRVSHRLGASLNLYMNLLHSILNAPMSFFDSTPRGQILNRFSADTLTMDEMVADVTYLSMDALLSLLSAMLAIAIATTGTLLLLLLPLMFVSYRFSKYYRLVNVGLSRLVSVSRSPVFADFSQMLEGLTSIRAFRKQTAFFKNMQRSVDTFTLSSVTLNAISMWLMIRLDCMYDLGSMFVSAIYYMRTLNTSLKTTLVSFCIAVIAVTSRGVLPSQFLGLALTYSFQLNQASKSLIRTVGMLDTAMNGVERITHYTNNIPQEKQTVKDADEEGDATQIPESWPSSGHIVAENVEMRYRDGPLVLKGISFSIQPGEKIGILGRTGSGKSSIMNAIFRIEDLVGGRITIDGLDIATVPLSKLRSSLGIIPQDSVMFCETVRFNLDPFKEHSDEAILDVLESINMKNTILNLPNKLNEKVAEGGDNFSAGQRQLLCIARTILRKPKILILDEATASVDNDADKLVQTLIRSEAFKDSTVLTIAHRLHTIRDYDKIMVLSDGKLCEMDTPEALLVKPDGLFTQLWTKANSKLC